MYAARIRLSSWCATLAALALPAFTLPARAAAAAPSLAETADSGEVASAAAGPASDGNRWDRRHFALEGVLASTLGAGLRLDWTLVRWISVAGGVGMSFSGPQVDFVPRARAPLSRADALVAELGIAYGPYDTQAVIYVYDLPKARSTGAAWLLTGIGYEHRWEKWQARIEGGIQHMLNPAEFECYGYVADDCERSDYRESFLRQPYLGIAVGPTF